MFRDPPAILSQDDAMLATATTNKKLKSGNVQKKQLPEAAAAAAACKKSSSSSLSELLSEKEYLTLSELEELRKGIESQQQIQMAIKHNNPKRVQIQCRHFKSKKCTFQITFKAVSASIFSSPSSPQHLLLSVDSTTHHQHPCKNNSNEQTVSPFSPSSYKTPKQTLTTTTKTPASTQTTTTTTTADSHYSSTSSTIFSGISYDSSVASAQLFKESQAAASESDIKRTSQSSTGRREESFTTSAMACDDGADDARASSRRHAAPVIVVAVPAGFPAAPVILQAAVTLDASCSPMVGSVEYCTPTTTTATTLTATLRQTTLIQQQKINLQSLRRHPQVGQNLSMSSWQQSNPPATKLLQNFDASATMWEGEKREEWSNKNINNINNHNFTSTSITTRSSYQAEQAERIILEAGCESSCSSGDDECESFLQSSMIDEGQLEGNQSLNLRSHTVSPFLVNDAASSSHPEVTPLFLNNNNNIQQHHNNHIIAANKSHQDVVRATAPLADTIVAAAAEADPLLPAVTNQHQMLFRMSTCKLLHRNHPVMSDEKYNIHLAKRWLEGHQEKIERIYEDLREKKESSLKITPKVIKKHLKDAFDIDIYAKCTDKEHKKFLKKKLDNLMKTIRLKEKANAKSVAQIKPESTKPKKERNTQGNRQTRTQQQQQQQPRSLKSKPSRSETNEEQTNSKKSTETIQEIKAESTLIPESDTKLTKTTEVSEAIEVEEDDEEYLEAQEEQLSQTYFISKPFAPPLPETSSSVQSKSVNEEWESFLQLELPKKRMQSTHC